MAYRALVSTCSEHGKTNTILYPAITTIFDFSTWSKEVAPITQESTANEYNGNTIKLKNLEASLRISTYKNYTMVIIF